MWVSHLTICWHLFIRLQYFLTNQKSMERVMCQVKWCQTAVKSKKPELITELLSLFIFSYVWNKFINFLAKQWKPTYVFFLALFIFTTLIREMRDTSMSSMYFHNLTFLIIYSFINFYFILLIREREIGW